MPGLDALGAGRSIRTRTAPHPQGPLRPAGHRERRQPGPDARQNLLATGRSGFALGGHQRVEHRLHVGQKVWHVRHLLDLRLPFGIHGDPFLVCRLQLVLGRVKL